VREKALNSIQNHTQEKLSIGNAKLPLVSIIITSYNYENYIKECIESCLSQNYPLCEVIVADDCSTDDTSSVLEHFGDKIKVVRNKKNMGQLATFFTGLNNASGDFTVFVDADDFLDNDAISAHLYLHLFQKPPVAFTCLRNRQVSASSALLNNFHMDLLTNTKKIAYVPPRVIHTPTWSWSTTSAMMFRTDLLRLIETEKTEDFRICADYYVVHFANLLGGSLLYDEAKVNYRRHGKNSFSKNFIIGGHRPTGSSSHHAHPPHDMLQKEIISQLLSRRCEFEPYFPTIARFIETVLYVADKDFITNHFSLNEKDITMLSEAESAVAKLKKEQIESKKKALEFFEDERLNDNVRSIIENLKQLYIK